MIQVNDTYITEAQVSSEMQYFPSASQREAMLKAAESLVIAELVRQRAKALALRGSDDGTEISADDYVDLLLETEVAIPKATDGECVHYYQSNRERFTSSPLLAVSHILIAAAPDDDEGRGAAKTQALDLMARLQQSEPFHILAETYSACPSKEVGGSLGQISRGQTVPEFERQVFPAEPGLLARPVESRYGFHLVYIEHKVPGKLLPYESVKSKVADYLNEKVYRKAVAQYIQTLIADASIDGYDFNVSASPLMQ